MELDHVVMSLISGDAKQGETAWSALKELDEAALPALAEALASAETRDARGRLARAFSGIAVTDYAAYLPYLGSGDAVVRRFAAGAFQGNAAPTVEHADALLPLLLDSCDPVRTRAGWVFRSAGQAVVPALVAVRRTPKSPLRTPVLELLADIVGFDGLDRTDQAAIRRLIEIKALGEAPEPVHLCGSWFALPTWDQAAVLGAFGLSDPVPVTMRLGASAWNFDHHNWTSRDEHRRCRRVCVSPGFDGWTLVFGNLPAAAHLQGGRAQEDAWMGVVFAACREVSRRFGEAHWYGMSCGDGWTAWCVARDGEIVRYYDAYEPDKAIGAPLPEESGYVLPHEDSFPDDAFAGVDPNDSEAFKARWTHVKEEQGIPDACDAALLAGELSIDPASLGPHTATRGRALLALTSCGRELGMPPGALQI
jgi:hypothetical protein